MDFANRGMTTSYQRQQGGVPGSVGYGGGGGNVQSGQGPFSVARGAQAQNPMLDLNGSQNPYTNGAIVAPPKAQAAQAGGLLGGGAPAMGGNGGNGGQSQSDTPFGGLGIGDYTDKLDQTAMDTFTTYAPISAVAAGVAALVQRGMSQQDAINAINSTNDPIGALNALQGWTETDPTYSFYNGESSGGGGSKGDANAGHGYGQGFGGGGWGGTTTGGY
jgi:hypothetical protein